MKIGVFFGGQSREREISFAGGRTVYDNLNKELFDPVPIFVDSMGNFILLEWEYIYKGTIRDFYPPADVQARSVHDFQLYIEHLGQLSPEEQDAVISQVGRRIQPSEFRSLFDLAFLALHGGYGEDGNIQGLLEWYQIPYTGSGILASAIGIDKVVQRNLLEEHHFSNPSYTTLSREEWLNTTDKSALFARLKEKVGFPFVVKAPHQGSSIGVSILQEDALDAFIQAVHKSLFIRTIDLTEWSALSHEEKLQLIVRFTDIRDDVGLPAYAGVDYIEHPDDLFAYLEDKTKEGQTSLELVPADSEEILLFESFIKGKEFSCIVIQDEQGLPIALPPTEIVKGTELFDYRSKYLPGMSRKVTPIQLETEAIERIRKECERLFNALQINVYARIDGFYTESGEIFLNDPNTTSGMLPSSFFFHQAAEIGLNPSQFLTYIVRTSLAERIKTGKRNHELRAMLYALDQKIQNVQQANTDKKKVAVVMGGFSSERHISVESGRNIYEKLSSSGGYDVTPVFLTGSEGKHELYALPVNVMLKDNADDIKEKVRAYHAQQKQHEILAQIAAEASGITKKYTGKSLVALKQIDYTTLAERVDFVFIALHGRPGEDGAVQQELEKLGLPYNGSGVKSSQLTINKYETNEVLLKHGVSVAKHRLVNAQDWKQDRDAVIADIEKAYPYPFIAKPADDGCSSAVKKVKNREELIAFTELIFRNTELLDEAHAATLKLKRNEEFPQKECFLLEELIDRKGAKHFLEITGGMLTHRQADGTRRYEVFEPSEALATGEVLSLEEKFLAGEGQNITPARFDTKNAQAQKNVSAQVRAELEKVAKILNIEGYARIDAFVRIFEDGKAETIIIEINSLPGMTPATCIFHQSAINGYKPYEFIDKIIEYGIHKQLKETSIS